MDEAVEALEGCMAILEAMEEDSHDPRHYTLIAAIRWAVGILDGISSCEMYHDSEATGQEDKPEFA